MNLFEIESNTKKFVDTEKSNIINKLKNTTNSCILILWLMILVLFHKKLILVEHKEYVLIGLIVSILMIIWNIFSKKENVDNKEIIVKKLKEEKSLAKLIPVMIFGLATLVGRAEREILLEIAPYLLLAVLFGTVIPFSIDFTHRRSNHHSLKTLVLLESIDYNSEVIAIGSIVSGIIYSYMLIISK
tara:strand:+ start:3443 stop:4003 length:561 start_codon:yes stop_codon:yes gene_type:complete